MHKPFLQLEQILSQHQLLWRFEPFHQSAQSTLPWVEDYPDLCHWLNALSIEQIIQYKLSTTRLLADVNSVFPSAKSLNHLVKLSTDNHLPLNLERGITAGIPGRKLQQITSMGSFLLNNHKGQSWIEWCAGKGYLGRILASHSPQLVTSFEWQQSLCEAGQIEAQKKSLNMKFIQGDALSPEAKNMLTEQHHAVALHACGDLHVRLIEHASAAGSQAISISPCCYHLIEKKHYQPLSAYAISNSTLNLSKAELRIPLQETVTGGQRVVRHREQEMSYRLGFDLLLKQRLDIEGYVAIPSIKKSMLAGGFEDFCYWAAEQKNIVLPTINFEYWQKKGTERFWHMERLSLAQQMFRRALELWLVYDRVLFLQEHGYTVTVTEFCDRSVTPRNIIIHAIK
ncbi:methyltransferase [Vibrio sp. TH_r3]|uniref:methyltransferase n=1 Tax=Vibrio sp. TH_r3 TaxID=3082084 RepID=UPI0029556899|nr:methyltransferase [Vibrio sp. TH_r3]MDV7103927.1 methyltransferase [Vibrio sp. TH_r3]